MDFSKFLASPENDEDAKWEGKDKSIKTSDEKDSSLVRRRSSQCIDKEAKRTEEARTDNAKRGPSADEEGRNTGSVAGKVFSGYLFAGSNYFVVFFVFASNLLCQARIQSGLFQIFFILLQNDFARPSSLDLTYG